MQRSPRSTKANKSSATSTIAVIPKAHGKAIPNNQKELMQFIQMQRRFKAQNTVTLAEDDPRYKQQEQEREANETKMMEYEDYTYKPEGLVRLKRILEALSLETSEMSRDLDPVSQEKAVELRNQKIRLEVQARKIAEDLEKEAKKKAAEERRAAVLERIRIENEKEEQRLREEAEAKQRILDQLAEEEREKERVKQRIKELQVVECAKMRFEEELSQLSELDYKEYLEKKREQEQEAARLAQYEEEQRQKDEVEKKLRQERMKELEEKKRKLAEIKRLQGMNGKNPNMSAEINAAREHQAKLAKQLKIQNKAKFITKKKVVAATAPSSETLTAEDCHVTAVDENSTGVDINAQVSSTSPPVAVAAPLRVIPNAHSSFLVNESVPDVLSQEQIAYRADISIITNEEELKGRLLEIMTEKRALRLEQRQMPATDPSFEAQTAALKQKLTNVAFQEKSVQMQLDKVVSGEFAFISPNAEAINSSSSNTKVVESGGCTGGSGAGGGRVRRPSLTSSNLGDIIGTNIAPISPRAAASSASAAATTIGDNRTLNAAAGSGVTQGFGANVRRPSLKSSTLPSSLSVATVGVVATTSSIDENAIFVAADSLLRECILHRHWLRVHFPAAFDHSPADNELGDSSTVLFDGTVEAELSNNIDESEGLSRLPVEEAMALRFKAHVGRIALLHMEVSKVCKSLTNSKIFDPVNYVERLTFMNSKLKNDLSSTQTHVASHGYSSVDAALADLNAGNKASTAQKAAAATSPTATVAPNRGSGVSVSGPTAQISTVTTSVIVTSKSTPALSVSAATPTVTETAVVTKKQTAGLSSPELLTNTSNDIVREESKDAAVVTEEQKEEEEEAMDLPEGWEACMNTSMATAAHHAAFHGFSEVLSYLSEYFDCFVMDGKGRTPLFYAALRNQLDCVAILLAIDPLWIDVGDEAGDTPLHASAISNGIEVLNFLLSCEANPDTANFAGLTPSHLARSKAALSALYNAGAQPYCVDSKSRLPLWFACSSTGPQTSAAGYDLQMDECVSFLCSVTPYEYLLWPDDEGETVLHKAASSGRAGAVDVLCQWLVGADDLSALNKKQHTAAHVASRASVLKVLFENGANLWTLDPKGRAPLFVATFFGRVECVSFLINIVANKGGASSTSNGLNLSPRLNKALEVLKVADKQGDTALHVGCLCGHLQCVILLLYYLRNLANSSGLTAAQLATKAGHKQIAHLIKDIEARKEAADAAQQSLEMVFGCSFSVLAATMLEFGSRWVKCYDHSYDAAYYEDLATGTTQWERPLDYDEPVHNEQKFDKAKDILKEFYLQYNPDKLSQMNEILKIYRNKYTDLFITLCERYHVQDLSMFAGVDLE